MPFYEVGGISATAAASSAFFDIAWPTGTGRLRLKELGITNRSASAAAVAFFRAVTPGVKTVTIAGQAQDKQDSNAIGTCGTTFTTQPTFGSGPPLRRVEIPAGVGSGVVWTWEIGNEAVLDASQAFDIYNPTGNVEGAFDFWAVWRE